MEWENNLLRRVREGLCVCCGMETEDFVALAEGVKMCREYCIDPPHRNHYDTDTITQILEDLNYALKLQHQ